VKGYLMKQRIKDLKKYGFQTGKRTYVIAEIGLNHGGNLKTAKELIDAAALTGVDAVKFQTYLAEKRAPIGDQAVYDILKKHELIFEDFKTLKTYTESKYSDLDFISTAFDEESVSYLTDIGCRIIKLASFDVVNLKLLSKAASTGATVILSVGMATLDEISNAVDTLKRGTTKIALLHCISAYPTKEEEANLSAIYSLQDQFDDSIVGHSDHTDDIRVPLYAVAAGAQIIEKHFKIDSKMDCIDAALSITRIQMTQMVSEIRRIETMFGTGQFGVRPAEKEIAVFRRPSQIP